MSFKIEDRVKVYDICQVTKNPTHDIGIVRHIGKNRLWVQMSNWGTPPKNNMYWFHEKQCRKLVKKKKSKFNPNDIKNTLKILNIIRNFNQQK